MFETEAKWQHALLRAAELNGWQTLHIGRTGKYQSVGAKGTLGNGWPDIFLCKPGRMLFIECKLDGQLLKPDQKRVVDTLIANGFEVYVLRPSDFTMAMDIIAG